MQQMYGNRLKSTGKGGDTKTARGNLALPRVQLLQIAVWRGMGANRAMIVAPRYTDAALERLFMHWGIDCKCCYANVTSSIQTNQFLQI